MRYGTWIGRARGSRTGWRVPAWANQAVPPPAPVRGSGPPWVLIGVVVGCASVVILAAVLAILAAIMLPAVTRAREAALRASCQNNLKQAGIVHKMFAMEHQGAWADLAADAPVLSFAWGDLAQDYITDPTVLLCPSSDNDASAITVGGLTDVDYIYFGYALTNEAEALAFLDAYAERRAAGEPFDTDLPAPEGLGSGGSNVFLKLNERFPDEHGLAAADIPVMMDRAAHHYPPGVNVLYMDGHTEYWKVGDGFPATEAILARIAEVASPVATP